LDTASLFANYHTYLWDALLIFFCAMSLLYSMALNRKLKNLQKLDKGLGASILTLTQTIDQTNQAARNAQDSTVETVETLRHLLRRCESQGPKIEALATELVRAMKLARKERGLLESLLDTTSDPEPESSIPSPSAPITLDVDIPEFPPQKSQQTFLELTCDSETQTNLALGTLSRPVAPIAANVIPLKAS